MSELHAIGVSALDPAKIEAVGSEFVRQGLLEAQRKSWDVFQKIRAGLQAGMTEIDGQKLALEVFAKAGVDKHWHRPQIRFGAGTALTYYDSLRADYRLQEGDLVYFDLGPVWNDAESGLSYEGDVGDTFVFGSNCEGERLIQAAHQLFEKGLHYWKENRCDGRVLYQYLQSEAKALGYNLIEKIDGHRVSDYPHVRYTKQRLSEYPFTPSDSLWILEFQMIHPTLPMGAFYEDLLKV